MKKQLEVNPANYDATAHYAHIKKWPKAAGERPSHDRLLIAYALGTKPGSKQALAVATYLRDGGANPNVIAPALHIAKFGDSDGSGAKNDMRNVIGEPHKGLAAQGKVKNTKTSTDGGLVYSVVLTKRGEACVARYCLAHGYINPLAPNEAPAVIITDEPAHVEHGVEAERELAAAGA